ncbi:ABC transporter permease [Paenibacillus pectinilyticus]|uniref:ABC transporter permease n=1 Tax=Paenibacillus pectinilyticus TaxID=512399 RepID=A0A1C0ZXZ5_9BACL|nr:ABC transporter permease [Paenibacillus pectinilyticus]OCT12995.1 ABC transporter permease [Paenibacillus pectinilyticus]
MSQLPVGTRQSLRASGNRIPSYLHGWIVPIIVMIVWQAAGTYGIVPTSLLPTPLAILKQFVDLAASGKLWHNLEISLYRAALGFLLGGSIGLLLGLSAGLGKLVERIMDPSLQMLRTVPLLALIPLFILWFGIGEFSKVLMIALGAFFPIYINAFQGVRSVDVKLYEVSRILQYSRYQQVTKLILPAALPHILLGLRLSLGISWLVLVVAELMGTSAGIGYMIQDARTYSKTDVVFVGIVIFALVGKLSDSSVRLLERKWLTWRDTFKG